ncbi:MAG: antibiotic biosynthesis monooxygenase, partial [Mucispirillum sp.]|nr:antibiotic biosynthesis monooxygenase [Mucispirillum sp.]
MIKVTAEFTISKKRESEFIKTAQELMEKSRMETGNISYGIYKSPDSG